MISRAVNRTTIWDFMERNCWFNCFSDFVVEPRRKFLNSKHLRSQQFKLDSPLMKICKDLKAIAHETDFHGIPFLITTQFALFMLMITEKIFINLGKSLGKALSSFIQKMIRLNRQNNATQKISLWSAFYKSRSSLKVSCWNWLENKRIFREDLCL